MILARVVPGQVWQDRYSGRRIQVVAATPTRAATRVISVGPHAVWAPRKGVRSIGRHVIAEKNILIFDPETGPV